MEALILRRNYPLPVTFADLRRAHADYYFRRKAHVESYRDKGGALDREWHAALKEATGATDDVYAVVDGREIHVARADYDEAFLGGHGYAARIGDLLEAADEAGYWERPREVRLDLQERTASIDAIGKVVQRSLAVAEARR